MADLPRDFDRVLAALHRAALDEARWPAAAALIEEACGATGNLLTVGPSGEAMRIDFHSCFLGGESREDVARMYVGAYYAGDEGMRRFRQMPVGRLFHTTDLYTEQELRTSPTYNEVHRRTNGDDGLVACVEDADGRRISWAVGNPTDRGGWRPGRIRSIGSLLPHIRQFVRVRQALVGAEALGAGLAGLLDSAGIGVLHLDRDGRVLAANAPSLDILRRGDGLRDADGVLRATLPADRGRLQRLLKRALPGAGNGPPAGGSMTLQRPRLRSRLELHVHPVATARADFGGRRAAALVLVVAPESRPRIDPARLSALLGLTPSEARVSALLAEGRPVREIAASTGYKQSYVRWLLKQVYGKQGVSGQVALVQRILTAYTLPRS